MKKNNTQQNQRREKPALVAAESVKGAKRKKRFRPVSLLTGSFLEREGLLKQIPFILYISFLFVLYIANSYYGEKTVFEIEKYKSELIELRSEYISAKTRLMTSTNLSRVIEKLTPMGIVSSHTPPDKIFVKKTDHE